MQIVVLDSNFVSRYTLMSGTTQGSSLQETLCRQSQQGNLENLFYLEPVGQPGLSFTLSAFELPHSQLFIGAPQSDIVGTRPHFFYVLFPSKNNNANPLSVAIDSPTVEEDMPFQLQVSWRGCPDITLRDASHQVLTFTSKATMLILPSQFSAEAGDVLYIGLRPRPGMMSLENSTTFRKNITLVVSHGGGLATSPVAIVQWSVMLGFLAIFALGVIGALLLFFRGGVKRLQGVPSSQDFLADELNRAERRSRGRSKVYLWMVVMSGLFYLLPSLQTAGSEASSMITTGNRDLCYYNEECMFPLQTFGPYGVVWWAANNVVSNTGYILGGMALFAWTMWCKRRWRGQNKVWTVLSLPQDYALYYCLAVALFYEGLMSATYHICPTRLIFTIDTAFMFVGSILITLEVYRKWFRQVPHPAFPFFFLAIFMVFNYFGTFLDMFQADNFGQSDTAANVLWVIGFIIIWCLLICLISVRHRHSVPKLALVIMTGCNCLLGFLPVVTFLNFSFTDRSSLLLGVALSSAMLNLLTYVFGTLPRAESNAARIFRLLLTAAVFGAAGPAVWFFSISPSNKALSPWQSREMNAPCASSFFYDAHDLWHMLSAVALTLTILLLMHCGEDPHNQYRKQMDQPEETTALL